MWCSTERRLSRRTFPYFTTRMRRNIQTRLVARQSGCSLHPCYMYTCLRFAVWFSLNTIHFSILHNAHAQENSNQTGSQTWSGALPVHAIAAFAVSFSPNAIRCRHGNPARGKIRHSVDTGL